MKRLAYRSLLGLSLILLLAPANSALAQEEPEDPCEILVEVQKVLAGTGSPRNLVRTANDLRIVILRGLKKYKQISLVGLTTDEMDALQKKIAREIPCLKELEKLHDPLIDKAKKARGNLQPTAVASAELRRAEETLKKRKETEKALDDSIALLSSLYEGLRNRRHYR